MTRHRNRRVGWLWWMALFIVFGGLLISHVIVSQPFYSEAALLRVWIACLFLAGVCVISATSGWWLR